jgi:methylated-DNA-[protein]-cysteine S-methyltransferase
VGIVELLMEAVESPIGTVLLVERDGALCAADFSDFETRLNSQLQQRFGHVTLRRHSNASASGDSLRAYLAGELDAIDTIPVDPGGTGFQRRVWGALRAIPAGTTTTYGALAARLGRPTAARAVGRANALNPAAIVIPCHRLVGADNSLTGYAGGLSRKRWLLAHERAR